MKYDSIRLSGVGQTITLPVANIATLNDPYILKAADGLGPVERELFTAPKPGGGEEFQGSRAVGREIVLRIELNADPGQGQTPSTLRRAFHLMYSQESTRISLYNGGTRVADTYGHLYKMEDSLFVKETEVQLTFSCEEPNFTGSEFRYGNYANGVVGVYPSNHTMNGDAQVGFTAVLKLLEPSFVVTLRHRANNLNRDIRLSGFSFQLDDEISINTIPGQRDVSLQRTGSTQTLLHRLYLLPEDDPIWPLMQPGVTNTISMPGGVADLLSFSYVNEYLGV